MVTAFHYRVRAHSAGHKPKQALMDALARGTPMKSLKELDWTWLHDIDCRCRHKYGTHMHANSAFVSSWCGQCMCPHFRPWFIAPWPFLYPARDIYPDQ